MSKVVKSVGKAISGVVKGVAKVVKGVVKGVGNLVKKVAKSPLGRILITAAAVYFGGAALQGAFQGASAGQGFLGTLQGAITGAGQGVTTAWTNLTNAATSFFNPSSATAGGGAAPAASTAADGAAAFTSATPTGLPTVAADAAGAVAGEGSKGLIGSVWDGLGQYGKAAAVQGAMQIGGGLISGIGQQKALEEQRAYEEEKRRQELARYNVNVGTQLWGDQPTGGGAAPAGTSGDPYQPLYPAGGPQTVGMPRPMIASAMQPMQFPIYNPAIFRTA